MPVRVGRDQKFKEWEVSSFGKRQVTGSLRSAVIDFHRIFMPMHTLVSHVHSFAP